MSHIAWTDGEWRSVAVALADLNPVYLREPGRPINPQELLQAMAVLAPQRRRPLNVRAGATQFKARLNEVWQTALAGAGAAGGPPAPAAPGDAPAPAQDAHDDGDWRSGPRITWRSGEYLLMARWLRAHYPGAQYLDSPTALGLDLEDLRQAMRAVLAPDRHRALRTMTPLRGPFIEAFAAAKKVEQQLADDAKQAGQRAAEQARQDAYRAAEQAALEARKLTHQQEPPAVSAPAADVPAAVASPVSNGYEAAFAPLLRPLAALFAQELAAALVPALRAALVAVPAATVVVPPAVAHGAPLMPAYTLVGARARGAPPPPAVRQLVAPARAPVRQRRPKVGLVGVLPVVVQQIETAFPGIEFVARHEYTSTSALDNAFNSCDRVIAFTKFINHSQRNALVRVCAERLSYVNGGGSEARRMIQFWINDGLIALNKEVA